MPESEGHAIGIDIGVTNVKHVCVTADGQILNQGSIATGADSLDWPSRIRRLLESIARDSAAAIAVGLAAPVRPCTVAMDHGSPGCRDVSIKYKD